ncbi:MAG TPA: hypothetical protein VFB82_04680, partial [Blastocatellia bacterium]|nr:hypothetical protein [Blastocatellia bacterium]
MATKKKILLALAPLLLAGCGDRSAPPDALSARDVSRDSKSASAQANARRSDSATIAAGAETQHPELWDPNDDRDINKRLLERVKQEGVVRIVSVLASKDKYIFVGEFEVSSQDVAAERPMNKNGSETLRSKRPPLHGTDLWLVNKNGTGLQRLTDDGVSHDPVLSPSGEEIAFVSNDGVRVIDLASNGTETVSCGSTTRPDDGVHVEYSQPT